MKLTNSISILLSLIILSCGNNGNKAKKVAKDPVIKNIDPMNDKGIGPIKSIEIKEFSEKMANEGREIFLNKCSACHKEGKKFIGPNLAGVFSKRSPEWIMNMILNPEEMVQKNESAKKLLIEFNGAPMANQNLTEEEARKILEYIRSIK